MKILFANSNTSSNIGNAFFYEGVRFAVDKAAKQAGIDISITDSLFCPVNPYGLKGKYKNNYLDYFRYNDGVDALLIAGPLLDNNFHDQFYRSLTNARKYGKKIIMLSAGSRAYDSEEEDVVGSVLEEIKPDLFISRDLETFQRYGKYAEKAHDGICFAFFANDLYQYYPTDSLEPYITMCFDFNSEPKLSGLKEFLETGNLDAIHVDGKRRKTTDKIGRLLYYLDSGIKNNSHLCNVVRTCHRPARSGRLIFNRENTLASYSYQPYLNIYANTCATITDRLHAAVATMAFGKPARLFLVSSRTKLLKRAGASGVLERFCKLDQTVIADEKRKMVDFIRHSLFSEKA